jgi:hypothetical protein
MEQRTHFCNNLLAALGRDAVGIGIEVEFGDVDDKSLRGFGVSLFDRIVRIKKAPLKWLCDEELMLGFGLARPFLPFDNLDPEKLDDEQREKDEEK